MAAHCESKFSNDFWPVRGYTRPMQNEYSVLIYPVDIKANPESPPDREHLMTQFPIDSDGSPASDAAFSIITWLFRNNRRAQSVADLARILRLPQELIATICRRLKFVDVLTEDPPESRRYKYNLRCWDIDLQSKVEKSLLDYSERMRARYLPPLPQV
jgi:hypothetical protein